jgi:lysozyme family protein
MKLDYQPAYKIIRVYEGGNVDDKNDPGGRTSRGLTQASDNAYRDARGMPRIDVYKETEEFVSDCFKVNYWDHMRCDDLARGMDLCLFDALINSGPGNATKWAQAQLGLEVDGSFGAKTYQALRGVNDIEAFIEGFCARRLATLKGSRNWKRYGKGWGARIANVKKISQSWAQGNAVHPDVVQVEHVGGNQKVKAADLLTAPSQITPIATATVGSVGQAATTAASSLDSLKDTSKVFLYGFIAVTILGVAAGFAVKVMQDREKARASGQAIVPVDEGLDAGLPTLPSPATPVAPIPVAPAPVADPQAAPAAPATPA